MDHVHDKREGVAHGDDLHVWNGMYRLLAIRRQMQKSAWKTEDGRNPGSKLDIIPTNAIYLPKW